LNVCPALCAEGFDDDGRSVTAHLKNGERVEGRALIACDGLWSKNWLARLAFGPTRRSGKSYG
jgi:salicylate hydroxylase